MQHDRTGIQVDKPIPPWERPGCFRMDCEPHRGTFLTLCVALPSFFLCVSCLIIQGDYFLAGLRLFYDRYGRFGPYECWVCVIAPEYQSNCHLIVVLSAVGFVLGLTAWLLARRDLAKMMKGLIDPHGRAAVGCARFLGMLGWVGNGFFVVFNGAMIWVVHAA